jgi:CYTH domain-containing protein
VSHHLPREIERKYLLSALPEQLRQAAPWQIRQGYLPGERLIERVRHTVAPDGAERYVRTVKLGRGVERIEVEEPTDRETFAVLWTLTAGRRVQKRRYRVPDGAFVWEIDQFDDRPLVLAEIELPAADTVVSIPSWLAPVLVREVTDDGRYTNAQLARTSTLPSSD